MNLLSKILFFILPLLIITGVFFADESLLQAQGPAPAPPPIGDTPDAGTSGGNTKTEGLVPCGVGTSADGTAMNPCDLCHLYTLSKNVIDFLLFDIALPVAIIALLIGGIFLLASRGNPQMIETGKRAIANVVIGAIIAFAAWLIIATVVNTLGYNNPTAPWNEAPTCMPSEAGTGTTGGGGAEPECDPTATPTPTRGCTVAGSGASGFQYCQSNGRFSSECMERCDASKYQTTEPCKIGNCDGTRICRINNNVLGTVEYAWSQCQDIIGDECVPSAQPPSGDDIELIAKMKAQGVTFSSDSTGDCLGQNGSRVGPATNVSELNSGSPTLTTCFSGCKGGGACYPPGDSRAASLHPDILPSLEVTSRSQDFTVNSISTGDHSTNSKHYQGKAVDLLPPTESLRQQALIGCNNKCTAVNEGTHIHVSWP